MPERKVPLTLTREYAFSGTLMQATAEAQRVGKRDFDWFPYVEVKIETDNVGAPDDLVQEWTITINGGPYLKMPTDFTPNARPDPYQY